MVDNLGAHNVIAELRLNRTIEDLFPKIFVMTAGVATQTILAVNRNHTHLIKRAIYFSSYSLFNLRSTHPS